MLARTLDLATLLSKKSLFLFGPRATGKTHLVRETLPNAQVYNLLRPRDFSRLLADPGILEQEIAPSTKLVVIDEVQKLPGLLDVVHHLIETQKTHFLLTGSSARKLKRGHANLLGGRAWTAALFPLTSNEIPEFDLLRYLNRGGLPGIWTSEDPGEDLQSYVETYLREEIAAEALTRRLDQFARFLDVMGLTNGQELAYESLSRDTGIQSKTIRNYVEVLSDTLLGFELTAFGKTTVRKSITRSKFYLFDVGVANTLARQGVIHPKSVAFGVAFEHFLILEVRAYLSYRRLSLAMTYWRTTSQMEVDLIIGSELALEFKASARVTNHDLKGLKALREEGMVKRYMVVSQDAEVRTTDEISIMPWRAFLTLLWSDKLLAPKRAT
jgi:uncharacterized protein